MAALRVRRMATCRSLALSVRGFLHDPVVGVALNGLTTPSAYPLTFLSSGATGQLPTTVTAASLTVGSAAALPYVGLF